MKKDKTNLIILSDYGLDDAVALAHIAACRERFNNIDVITVAGNVTESESLKNLKRLYLELGGEKSGIRLISSSQIKQHSFVLPAIHGGDGVGDILPCFEEAKVKHIEFSEYLSELTKISGFSDTVILSLGTLTVTEELLKVITPKLLLIMAGAVDAEPNFRGMEFNEALDVKAYEACLKYPHLIATLDTCRHEKFNLAGHRFKGGENNKGVLSKLINRAVELAEARHPDNSYIYDFIASLYLTKPEIFTVEVLKDKRGNTLHQLKLSKEFSLSEYINNL